VLRFFKKPLDETCCVTKIDNRKQKEQQLLAG